MKKVKIEQSKILEPVKWQSRDGKKTGDKWSVGIKVAGVWWNGTCWNEKDLKHYEFEIGKEYELKLYKEKGTGKYEGQEFNKFELPSEMDIVLSKLKALYGMIQDLDKRISKLEKPDIGRPVHKINEGLDEATEGVYY